MGYVGPDMLYRILRDEAAPRLEPLQKLADHINEPIGDLLPNSGIRPASDDLRAVAEQISSLNAEDRSDIIAALAITARSLANAINRRGGFSSVRDISPAENVISTAQQQTGGLRDVTRQLLGEPVESSATQGRHGDQSTVEGGRSRKAHRGNR